MKKKIEQLEKRIDVLSEMLRKHIESKSDMKFATLNADTINSYFGVQKPEVIKSKFKLGDYVITKSGISGRVKQVVFGNGYYCYSLQDASVSSWQNWYLESELSEHEIVQIKTPMRDCQNCSVVCSLFCSGCPRGANWRPNYKEPIIGELAIFWDIKKAEGAFIRIFTGKKECRFGDNRGFIWDNAVLFESYEQYKFLLKNE